MILDHQVTAPMSASLGLTSTASSGYVLRQLLIDADSAHWRELRDPRITGTCQGNDSCCGGTSVPGARAAVGWLRRSLL